MKSTESCGNGFSPRFNGPACAAGQSSKDAHSGKVGSAARNVDQAPQPNTTGTCAADQASKDGNVGKSGKVAADGRNVDQAPQPNSNGTFITGACTDDAGCISNCCVSGKCRAPLSLKPGVEACQSGFSPNFG